MAGLAWNPDAWWEVRPDWLFRGSSISFFVFEYQVHVSWASQVAPANAGNTMQVQSWVWEDCLATHSNILAWEVTWTEEPGGLQSMGSQRVRHN